jgi:choice-of-anchor C domain-containing protein
MMRAEGKTAFITVVAGIVIAAAPASSAAAAPLTAPSHTGSTNLVLNGSFEVPNCAPSFCEFGAGSTAIPHWKVGGSSIDLVYKGYFEPARGSQSVDLSGSAPGSVLQVVPTTAGSTYTLSWHLAGNPVCGQAVKTIHVFWNSKLVDSLKFNVTNHTPTSMGWVSRHITVKAQASTSSVEFADATPDKSQCGAALDEVSLVQA